MVANPFARFVIYYSEEVKYKDNKGRERTKIVQKKIIENKDDDNAFDNAPRQNAVGIGILFDPLPLYILNREKDEKGEVVEKPVPVLNPVTGQQIRYVYNEHKILGELGRKYQFFQFKDKELFTASSKGPIPAKNFPLVVGMVLDNQGNCVFLEGVEERFCNVYHGTVDRPAKWAKDGPLNRELLQINLDELDDPVAITSETTTKQN